MISLPSGHGFPMVCSDILSGNIHVYKKKPTLWGRFNITNNGPIHQTNVTLEKDTNTIRNDIVTRLTAVNLH